MKRRIGPVLIGGILILSLILSSCSLLFHPAQESILPEPPEEYYLGFAREKGDRDVRLLTEEEVTEYVSEFAPFSSRVYYEALSSRERVVYHALEYALAKGYPQVIVDERLTEEMERSPAQIVNFLSLDSPFLEQNLHISTGHSSLFVPTDEGTCRLEASYVLVDALTEEKRDKKREALQKAQKIAEEKPEGLLEDEIAEYYYDYLTQNVSYRDYEEGEERHYLYDALVQGFSHCDGFANAYSLLCRLSGLSVFEKQVLPDEEGEVGHVWNSVRFNGKWYNVDCALGEESAAGEKKHRVRIRFGYSDELQTATPMYHELLPLCEESLIPVSLRFDSQEDRGFLDQIEDAFQATRRHYILMELKSGELSGEMLSRLVGRLDSSITYILCDWNDSHYCYLIKKR